MSVGGFRAREEAEKAERERQQQAEASRRAQQSEAGKEAHRQAVLEAQKRAREQEGTQRIKVRTDYSADTASSTIRERSGGRSERRDSQQFSQSGAPVNLQGDKQAVQQVRAQAFSEAVRKKQAQGGGQVTQADINRETRNILSASGGRVSVVDEESRRRAIEQGFSSLKGEKSIPESDMAYLTPVQGIRSRSVFEGRYEGGGIERVTFTAPKIERVAVDKPPPPNDFAKGAAENLKNLAIDFELGSKGAGIGIGSIFAFANPNAQKNLIGRAETEGRIAESKTGRELEREFVGSVIETGRSAFSGKPSTESFGVLGRDIIASPQFFAGSAATSAALWLTPFGISRIVRTFGSAPKAAARARFDYSPQYGSFADRESIRFTHFQPTRWENPEMLADLAKFKMSPDIPKVATIAPLTSVRTAEAFVSVQSKQDPIIQTRGGALLLKTEPVRQSSKVESIALQTIKQQTRSDAGPSIRQTWKAPTVPLGIGGITGVERRRKREDSIFNTNVETIAFPRSSSRVFERMPRLGSMMGQSNLTGLSSSITQRGRQDIIQRSNIAQMLRDVQLTSTMQSTMTAQITKQITQQRTGQVFRTTTKFNFRTVPSRTIPVPPLIPVFGKQPKGKKGQKRGRGRAIARSFKAASPLAVLGTQSGFAKEFERLFGKLY